MEGDRWHPFGVGRMGRAAAVYSLRSPARLYQIAQSVPVSASTSVMVATGTDSAAGKLKNVGRLVAMLLIPWTNLEDPPGATFPRFGAPHLKAVSLDPLLEIKAATR